MRMLKCPLIMGCFRFRTCSTSGFGDFHHDVTVDLMTAAGKVAHTTGWVP